MKDLLVVFLYVLSGAAADHDVHLVPAHIICPGVTKAHDILIPDPHDCSIYYKCKRGLAIPQTCPSGLLWCQILKECVLPAMANCAIGHKVVTYSPDELATYHPITPKPEEPSANENICPYDNILLPDPLNCEFYYRCNNGTPKKEHCPKGTGYSCWIGECVDSTIANCLSKPQDNKTCAVNGKKLRHPEDCHKYIECKNNKVETKKCPHNQEYNEWFMRCYEHKKAHCQSYEITTTKTTYSPGTTITPSPVQNLCPKPNATVPDPSDCTKYFKCDANNKPRRFQCPDNLKYSCWDKECEAPVIAECSNDVTVGESCPNNFQKIAVPGKCNKYYECKHNIIQETSCEGDRTWNQWFEQCVNSMSSHCSTHLTTSTSTTTPASTPAPSQTINICPIPDAKYPDELDCNKYYVCINDTPISFRCDENKEYSCWDQECLPPQTANCINGGNQTEQACDLNGDKQPNPNDCKSYFECENGTVKQKTCDLDMAYNKFFKKCVNITQAHCNETSSTTTGTTVNPNDTTTGAPGSETTTKSGSTGNSSGSTASIPDDHSTTSTKTSVNPNDTTTGAPGSETTTKSYTTGNSSGSTASIPDDHSTTSTKTSENPNGTTTGAPGSETTTKSYTTGNSSGSTASIPDDHSTTSTKTSVNPNDTTTGAPGSETTTKSGSTGNSSGSTASIPDDHSTTSTKTSVNPNGTTTGAPGSETTTKSYTTGNSSGSTASIPDDHSTTSTKTSENPNGTTTGAPGSETTTKSYTTGNSSGSTASIPDDHSTTSTKTSVNPNDTTTGAPGSETTTKSGSTGNSSGSTASIPDDHSTTSTKTSVNPNDTTTGAPGSETTAKSDSTGNSSGSTASIPGDHSTTPASTPAPSPVDDICPIQGAKIPDEMNCLKYYVCENNKPVSYQCGDNLEYSCWDQDCVPPQDATCINAGNQTGKSCSKNAEKLPNTNDCGTYFECVNGTVEHKSCEADKNFNKNFQNCYEKDLAHCKPAVSTTPGQTIETSSIPSGSETTPKSNPSGNSSESTASIPIGGSTIPASTPAPSPVDDICPIQGAKIPDEMNCLKYYVCENNKPVSYQCGDNLEYSCWDQDCVPPQDATCINAGNQTGKSCSKNAEKLPNTNDCGTYFECVNGTVEHKSCEADKNFNKNFQNCYEKDLAHCKPAVSTTPGQTIETSSIPSGSETTPKSNPSGNSSESTASIPIGGSTIPASTPAPSPVDDICPIQGAKIPDEMNCLKYYVCENNKPVSYQCGDNLEYSCWDQDCVPPQDATCINAGNQTGKSCSKNAEKLPNTNDCGTYFECVNGTVEHKSCEADKNFNKNFQNCYEKDLAHCKPAVSTTPGQTIETSSIPSGSETTPKSNPSGNSSESTASIPIGGSTTPASTPAPSPVDDICPIQGAKIPDEMNCLKYYVCENNKPVSYQCGDNLEYSCWDQDCVPPQDATCINAGNQTGKSCSKNAEKLPNTNDCGTYFECVNGTVEHKSCEADKNFNKNFQNCYEKDLAHCKPAVSTTPGQTIETSSIPSGSETTPKSNPSGNSSESTASIPIGGSTTPASTPAPSPVDDICPIQGAKIPDEMNCLKYYVCENNKPVSYQCGDNLEYSCWDQDCVPPQDATCINAGNQTGKSCSKNAEKLPNTNDCGTYFECVNGTVEHKSCEADKNFNKNFQNCYEKDLAHCKPAVSTTPGQTIETSSISSGSETNTTGPSGSHTASTATISITPSPTQNICEHDGDVLPNPSNCSTYYKCVNHEPQIESCADGLIYSCWDETCVQPGDGYCIPGQQPGQKCMRNGKKLQNTENCHSYYECVDKHIVSKTCTDGKFYNKWFRTCMSFQLAHCNKDSTITPPPTNRPNSTLPPQLFHDICPIEGAVLPNQFNCKSYYKCENNKPVSYDCPKGQGYSCWEEKCQPLSDAHCIADGTQVGLNCSQEGLKLQNVENCASNYICKNGQVQIQGCSLGMEYSKWYTKCVLFPLAHCTKTVTLPPSTSVTPSPTPNIHSPCTSASKMLPDVNNCKKYYKCENGKYKLQTCPDNLLFNYFTQSCAKNCFKPFCSKDPNANNYPQSSNCLLLGLKLPNPFTCDKYFECNSFMNMTEKQCPSGKKYAWLKMNCVTATTGQCAPTVEVNATTTTTENSGSSDTTFGPPITSTCSKDSKPLPDVNNAKNYYECTNGKYELKTCKDNKLWNCITQSCGNNVYAPCCSNDPNAAHYPQFSRCGLLVNIKVSNPFNCDKYFECSFLGISQRTCPSGESFDWPKSRCVNAKTGKCVPTVPTTPDLSTTTTIGESTSGSSGPTVGPPVTSTCSKDSKPLPDVNNAKNYYECTNGKYELKTCTDNKLWNCITQSCGNNVYAPCCSNDPNAAHYPQFSKCGLLDNIKVSNPFNCNKYFECSFLGISQRTCPSGESFDWPKSRCVNAKTGKCVPTVPTTPDLSMTTTIGESTSGSSGPTVGPPVTSTCSKDSKPLPDVNNAKNYYECTNGKYELKTCKDNKLWNCITQSCGNNVYAPCCSNDPNAAHYPQFSKCGLLDNIKVSNPFNCNKYFECSFLGISQRTCPSGESFDWPKSRCVNAKTGKCVPTVPTTPDLSTTTTIGESTSGSSGPTVGPPVTSTCSKDSKPLPDVNNAKNYYECTNGKYELKTCKDNKLWNCITQSCGNNVYAPCCSNDPNAAHYPQFSRCGLLVNIMVSNPFNCDKYFECSFLGISQKTCPSGESFDWPKSRCVTAKTGKCIPTVPTTNTPGTVTPALSTASVSGEPAGGSSSTTEPAKQTTGESTTGSSSTSSSTKSDSTNTSDEPTVPTTNKPGTATPAHSTTSVSGEPAGGSSSTTEPARPTTGESTTRSSSTSSSTKSDSTNTSDAPTTNTPTTGTASSTKKPSPLCPDTTKLIRYPAPDDCFGYFECQNRQLIKKKCISGQNYDCRTKLCEPSTNPIHCCSTPTTTTTKLPIL